LCFNSEVVKDLCVVLDELYHSARVPKRFKMQYFPPKRRETLTHSVSHHKCRILMKLWLNFKYYRFWILFPSFISKQPTSQT